MVLHKAIRTLALILSSLQAIRLKWPMTHNDTSRLNTKRSWSLGAILQSINISAFRFGSIGHNRSQGDNTKTAKNHSRNGHPSNVKLPLIPGTENGPFVIRKERWPNEFGDDSGHEFNYYPRPGVAYPRVINSGGPTRDQYAWLKWLNADGIPPGACACVWDGELKPIILEAGRRIKSNGAGDKVEDFKVVLHFLGQREHTQKATEFFVYDQRHAEHLITLLRNEREHKLLSKLEAVPRPVCTRTVLNNDDPSNPMFYAFSQSL